MPTGLSDSEKETLCTHAMPDVSKFVVKNSIGEPISPRELLNKPPFSRQYTGTGAGLPQSVPIDVVAKQLRDKLKNIEMEIRLMMDHTVYEGEQSYPGQHSEMKAQTMLAVRACEDSRLRLGKVCQYADDGVSIFDKM